MLVVALCGSSACATPISNDTEALLTAGNPFGDAPRPVSPLEATFRPPCAPGGILLDDFTDGDGTPRRACIYVPSGIAGKRLPLVVFLHPSMVGPDLTAAAASLQNAYTTADLTGDPARPGFVLLEPLGRIIDQRFYPKPDQGNSPGWDNWYRQPAPVPVTVNGTTYPPNVDAMTIDHYIAEAVASGQVDARRIYLTGWSNGSSMAILYGSNRAGIAAAAVYSAPDPFEAFSDPHPQVPVAGVATSVHELQLSNPQLPILHVHNSCDIGGTCPNALYMADTLAAAGGNITSVMIDSLQHEVQQCVAACGTDPTASELTIGGDTAGTLDHLRWPSQWTDQMFAFLRAHPHG